MKIKNFKLINFIRIFIEKKKLIKIIVLIIINNIKV